MYGHFGLFQRIAAMVASKDDHIAIIYTIRSQY